MSVHRPHVDQRKAFTLLELILVMIILCTVLAMAAPTLRGFFSSRQINDMSEQIIIMTRYAKIQSIFEGISHRVNFDPMERRYWISSQVGSEYERLRTSFGQYYMIPAEIKLDFDEVDNEAGIYYFEFNSLGYSKETRLRLEDNKENILEIVCYSPPEDFEIVKDPALLRR